jgi:signal peptidase
MIWAKRAANVVLTLLAILGLAGGALFVGIKTGHVQTFMFTSGSMHPEFQVDDAVISRNVSAADLRVGDVVTVPMADGRNVTHRIVEIAPGGTAVSRELTLRGDANSANDPSTYTVDEAFVPVLRIPQGGAIIQTIREPMIGIPLAAGAVGLIGFVMLASEKEKPRRKGDDGPTAEAPQGDVPVEPAGRRRALEPA